MAFAPYSERNLLSHFCLRLFFLITLVPPRSTLFPYTTLFRSRLQVYRRHLVPLQVPSSRSANRRAGSTPAPRARTRSARDRKSTRLNSSHTVISYAVFCLKKKKQRKIEETNRKDLEVMYERCD